MPGAVFDEESIRLIEQVVRRVLTQMQVGPMRGRIRPAELVPSRIHEADYKGGGNLAAGAAGTFELKNFKNSGTDTEKSCINETGAQIDAGATGLIVVEATDHSLHVIAPPDVTNLLADHEARITTLEGFHP